MAALVGRGRAIVLEATITTLGSAASANVSVPSPHVSRVHALVVRDRRGWLLIDFRSANGVAVNGVPIEVQRLRDGDTIQLSGASDDEAVRFEFRDEPASPPPARTRAPAVSPVEAALRVAQAAAVPADEAAVARAILDELLALTVADRAVVQLPDGRVISRRSTPAGATDDAGALLPEFVKRLQAGEELVFVAELVPESLPRFADGERIAMALRLQSSVVCAMLRLRGVACGMLQLERQLTSEPFTHAAADIVRASQPTIALALAAARNRA
jgi:hypothetical protein